MLKRYTATFLLCCALLSAAAARCPAASIFDRPGGTTPSIFYYGWRGLFVGALAGASAGYIRYADSNNTNEMLKSLAYGGLAGAGVGLIAGFADVSNGNAYGTGDMLLRGLNRGGGFGLAVGVFWGGINAIAKSDSREIASGAAWGYLGGMIVGLGAGIVESVNGTATTTVQSGPATRPSIIFLSDSNNQLYPAVHVECRY